MEFQKLKRDSQTTLFYSLLLRCSLFIAQLSRVAAKPTGSLNQPILLLKKIAGIWSMYILIYIFLSPFILANQKAVSVKVPQSLKVSIARNGWKNAWKILIAELAPQSSSGAYLRPQSRFKLNEDAKLSAESGRYHIYLGNPCPWCHRVAITCALLNIDSIRVSKTKLKDDPIQATRGGWAFSDDDPENVFRARDLAEVYDLCSPGYSGKVTAPLLIDRKSGKIISNESKDIVHLLSSVQFPGQSIPLNVQLRPESLRQEISEKTEWLYINLNNAVYRAGFATEQLPYDNAVESVVRCLTSIDNLLSKSKFLHGDMVTESDVFLLPTVVRFDSIYAVLFRCTGIRIADCVNIKRWLRDMYSFPGVAETYDHNDAVRSYYQQMFPLNPSRIIPKFDFESLFSD